MPALAVKPKLASGQKTSFDAIRINEIAHLVADLPQERSAANDELASGQSVYAYVANNPLRWIDPDGLAIKLPGDPSGLPSGWTPDPSHQDPNGERWRGPGGDYVDWHKGRPGMPGWRGKDHWHHNGGKEHLPPGTEIPDPPGSAPACGDDCKNKVATVVIGTAGAYVVYRCVRMIPSLFPPLWPTIPFNAAAP